MLLYYKYLFNILLKVSAIYSTGSDDDTCKDMKDCGLLSNEENTFKAKNKDLTPSQCLVLAALRHAYKPVSAYELLDKLHPDMASMLITT